MALPLLSLRLRLRDAETILAARGIVASYETVREWGLNRPGFPGGSNL